MFSKRFEIDRQLIPKADLLGISFYMSDSPDTLFPQCVSDTRDRMELCKDMAFGVGTK